MRGTFERDRWSEIESSDVFTGMYSTFFRQGGNSHIDVPLFGVRVPAFSRGGCAARQLSVCCSHRRRAAERERERERDILYLGGGRCSLCFTAEGQFTYLALS